MRRWQNASFILGILVCFIAAFLMFEGTILGENNTGWAIVIGIVGIGLIATSTSTWRLGKAKQS